MTDHRIDPTVDQTLVVSAPSGPRKPQLLAWQPVRPELTAFMTNTTTCPICQMARQAAGLRSHGYLHVQVSGRVLTMTEVDDIHHPGMSLVATHRMTLGNTQCFQLDSVHVGGERVGGATGIAALGWIDRRRRLKVAGMAVGFKAHGDVIFDAVEGVGY